MMKSCARMVGSAAMVLALCTVLFSFADTWFGEQGSVLQFARELVNEKRRYDALQYRLEVVQEATDCKVRLISELLDGRLCLLEAIAQYQQINEQIMEDLAVDGMDQDRIAAFVPGPTDPEGVGRQILNWIRVDVGISLNDNAERRLADIEREFQKIFGRTSLPDSSANIERMPLDVGCNIEPHCELR